jgi:hypothetical protein
MTTPTIPGARSAVQIFHPAAPMLRVRHRTSRGWLAEARRDHVTPTCRSVGRIFLKAYVPKMQGVGWVCQFRRWQRGFVIPSSAAFGKIGEAYVRNVHRFAEANSEGVVKGRHGVDIQPMLDGEPSRRRLRPLSTLDPSNEDGEC